MLADLAILAMLSGHPMPLPESFSPEEKYGCSAVDVAKQPEVISGFLVRGWVGVKKLAEDGSFTGKPRWNRLLSTRPYSSEQERTKARRQALSDCDEWIKAVDKKFNKKGK